MISEKFMKYLHGDLQPLSDEEWAELKSLTGLPAQPENDPYQLDPRYKDRRKLLPRIKVSDAVCIAVHEAYDRLAKERNLPECSWCVMSLALTEALGEDNA